MSIKKTVEVVTTITNNLTDAEKIGGGQEVSQTPETKQDDLAGDDNEHVERMQAELQARFSHINELRKMLEIRESALGEAQAKQATLVAELEAKRVETRALSERLVQFELGVAEMRAELGAKMTFELELRSDNERLDAKIGKKIVSTLS